jgi:predicted dehydrogenase
MATNRKIRVGIVGANPSRGFASIAHIPALQALPDFEISAVCTSRQDSADAAAKHYGVPLAFCDAEKLAQDPNVDLVTVSVKVPDHAGHGGNRGGQARLLRMAARPQHR